MFMMTPTILRPSLLAAIASTWNPADKNPGVSLSADLLTATGPSGGAQASVRATNSRVSGKLYFEAYNMGDTSIGVGNSTVSLSTSPGIDSNSTVYISNGTIRYNNSSTGGLSDTTSGASVGVAVDLAARMVWFSVNGSWQTGNPAAGSGGTSSPLGSLFPIARVFDNASSSKLNVGTTAFTNAPPSGFTAWG